MFGRRALRDHCGRWDLTVGLAVFAVGGSGPRALDPFLRGAGGEYREHPEPFCLPELPRPRPPAVPHHLCPVMVPILSRWLTVISGKPRFQTVQPAAPHLAPNPWGTATHASDASSPEALRNATPAPVFGRAADRHLEPFLRLAKKYFMAGYRAVFYIMVDNPHRLPDLEPGPRQTFEVLTVAEDRTWLDLDLVCRRQLGELIAQHRVFQGHLGWRPWARPWPSSTPGGTSGPRATSLMRGGPAQLPASRLGTGTSTTARWSGARRCGSYTSWKRVCEGRSTTSDTG